MLRVGYCRANACPRHMWHFLTGIGQVSKLVMTVLRQHNVDKNMSMSIHICQKTANMLWAYRQIQSFYCYLSLIHCSTPTLYDISSSLLSTAHTILFISFSCYTLEWDKTIFTIMLTSKMLQKLTVPIVKSLLLNFHSLSNIMLCLK